MIACEHSLLEAAHHVHSGDPGCNESSWAHIQQFTIYIAFVCISSLHLFMAKVSRMKLQARGARAPWAAAPHATSSAGRNSRAYSTTEDFAGTQFIEPFELEVRRGSSASTCLLCRRPETNSNAENVQKAAHVLPY